MTPEHAVKASLGPLGPEYLNLLFVHRTYEIFTFPLLDAASAILPLGYPTPLNRSSSTCSHPSLSLVTLKL